MGPFLQTVCAMVSPDGRRKVMMTATAGMLDDTTVRVPLVFCGPLDVCCSGSDVVVCVSVATWLILPVVIRSSQRLSHACLSINLLL